MAWWPFTALDAVDGYVQDASGHGLRGEFVGDAGIITDPDREYVLSLDGEGDWIDCGQDTRYNLADVGLSDCSSVVQIFS